MLNADGTITTLKGDIPINPVIQWQNARPLTNKTLEPDGSIGSFNFNIGETSEDSLKLKMYEVQLPVSNWQGGSSTLFTQTLPVSEIKESIKCPIVNIAFTGTLDEKQAQQKAWNLVNEAEIQEGSILFTCFNSKPNVDLNIVIWWWYE